jgi:hypothetical protein
MQGYRHDIFVSYAHGRKLCAWGSALDRLQGAAASIQFASQIASATNVRTKVATPRITSCPKINCGRSAALILIIAPPEHIEM